MLAYEYTDIYLTSQALWNPDFDLDAAEDEAGALYYGKAWPAIRRYRRRLAAICTLRFRP